MLGVESDSLDLGVRPRRPTVWAVCAPEDTKPPKQRNRRKHRLREAKKDPTLASTESSKLMQATCKREARDPGMPCLQPEDEEGNVEYKYRLKEPNPMRLQKLITQMKFRLSEGEGECFYYIGIEDDGYPRGLDPKDLQASIAVLTHMAGSLSASARVVELLPAAHARQAAIVHIRLKEDEDIDYQDLRVVVGGSLNSGKSTLVSVLTKGSNGRPLLDNGHGSARMAVFRHKHEIESGRTSSICQQMLGYDEEGKVLNYAGVATPTPAELSSAAKQVLTFIDMGGHEKYLKTTLYGLTCMLPDYMILCVCSCTGITRTTREHLAVAVALEIPVAVAITKSEAVDAQQLQQVVQDVQALLSIAVPGGPVSSPHSAAAAAAVATASSAGCVPSTSMTMYQYRTADSAADDDVPAAAVTTAQTTGGAGTDCHRGVQRLDAAVISNDGEAAHAAAVLSNLRGVTGAARGASFLQASFPVFLVSSVTGQGLSLLHTFLSRLKPATLAGGVSTMSATGDAAGDGQVSGASLQLLPVEGQLWHSTAAEPGVAAVDSRDGRNGAGDGAPANGGTDGGSTQDAAGAPATPAAGSQVYEGHFQVAHTFDVEGVGPVVSGIAVAGRIEVGDQLLWGPTSSGGFLPVHVSGIQRSHVPVKCVLPGQTATLALSMAAASTPAGPDTLTGAAAGTTGVAVAAPAGAGGLPGSAQLQGTLGRSPQVRQGSSMGVASSLSSGLPQLGHSPGNSGSSSPCRFNEDLLDSLALDLEGGDDTGDTGDEDSSSAWGLEDRSPCEVAAAGNGGSSRVVDTAVSLGRMAVVQGAAEAVSAELEAQGGGVPAHLRPIPAIKLSSGGSGSSGPGSPLGMSPGNWRKGAVLLSQSYQPRTYWCFEALLVLLGGHWPARGLVSGCWPLLEASAAADSLAGGMAAAGISDMLPASSPPTVGAMAGSRVSAGGASPESSPRSAKRRNKRGEYAYVVHCNSVRQVAQLEVMQEVLDTQSWQQHLQQVQDAEQGLAAAGGRGGINRSLLHLPAGISSSIQAAAALLQAGWSPVPSDQEGGGSSSGASSGGSSRAGVGSWGSMVHVRMRFAQRPEWLQVGSRLIIRDRADGHVAAAGMVIALPAVSEA